VDLIHSYGSFFAGFLEAAYDLVHVETFKFAVFLSHHELHGFHVLVGCKAFSAIDAFLAPSRGVLWRIARFQSFEVFRPAVWTFHNLPLHSSLVVDISKYMH
jgi:hypothetical protein